jgi:hypothetical protein
MPRWCAAGVASKKARLAAGLGLILSESAGQSFTSMSTPLGRSSFMRASMVLAEGL